MCIRDRIKNKAAAQATFDEDYNVPDVKPDIGRLVQLSLIHISPDRSWKAGIFSMHEHNPVSTGYRCKEVSEGLLQTAVWQGSLKILKPLTITS